MELINPLVEQYASRFTTPHDELLHQIHLQSELHEHAHMLSSEVQGQFLSFISHIIQPKYILEIGTFTGYSALCLCKGLQMKGELHTIELRQADVDNSLRNFKATGKDNQIYLYHGNAVDIIPGIDRKWDLAFIDADKTNYITYYELVLERLSAKGIIIADNVLFHGQVLEEKITGKNAIAIHEFNRHVQNDKRTEQVFTTIRDGLLLIRKI